MLAKYIIKAACGIVFVFGAAVSAQDACSTRALHALADVTVSDGKTYQVESFFKSKDQAALRLIRENGSTHVVEGPITWAGDNSGVQLAGNFQRDFAIGHQFHAFLFHFDEIIGDINTVTGVSFAGRDYDAYRGVADTGGVVSLIDPNAVRPAGLRFELGDLTIDIVFKDWRLQGDKEVPFALSIDDGERTFEYRYQYVDAAPKPLMWFFENIPAPNLDAVQIYRLHRKQLIAHCLGDAEMLASTLAPNVVMANGGEMSTTTPTQTQSVFSNNVFKRRQYTSYTDVKYPAIEVATSGDLGWATVQLHTTGANPATAAAFDEQWAWTMLAKKIDGQWFMVGNASNRKP